MSYQLETLRPIKPQIEIGKNTYILDVLSLAHEVYFIETFGGLAKVFEAIEKDPSKLIDIFWQLLSNKADFNNSFIEFKKSAYSLADSITMARKMSGAIYESIQKSQPVVVNKKRMDELRKIQNMETNEKPCYARYYDTLAKRYGYTLDEFYNLTLRQVSALLETIGDESYKELEVQASLAGRELKPRMQINEVTEEQEKSQEQEAIDAVKRLQKQYEENK
jgi:hypothetical protein